MPRPAQLFEKFDPITADFTYIRWLGDRKGIEERTKTWDVVIVDRRTELSEWAEIVRKVHKRRIQIFAYANNHYAGHDPATVEMFRKMLGALVRSAGSESSGSAVSKNSREKSGPAPSASRKNPKSTAKQDREARPTSHKSGQSERQRTLFD
jgi:hypothetical protein